MADGTVAPVKRVHGSWLANAERRLLIHMAERIPPAIGPDGLTVLGLSGAILTGAGFAASWISPYFLLLAASGLILNWFGDSLDGTLARVRGCERRQYGFFVDHAVDAAAQVFVFVGLGLSPLMRLDTACLLLVSYWLATLLTLIRTIATGIFQISYYGIGPTEIRIALLLYTLCNLVFGLLSAPTSIGPISLIDIASIPIFLIVFLVFLAMIWIEARRLAAVDIPRTSLTHRDPYSAV